MLKIAIVGRPNVGKSTLFNRLVGKKLAIVDDQPGVTRDIREAEGKLLDRRFTLLDTAGLEDADPETLEGRMRIASEKAIKSADICLFLYDARAGVTPLDQFFAKELRKQPTPLLIVANKCEGERVQAGLAEAYSLGLGDPVPLSAEHGEGLWELYEALQPYFEQEDKRQEDHYAEALEKEASSVYFVEGEDEDRLPDISSIERTSPIQLAVMGRPNAGKSTLVNAILGDERMLTGPEAGITRDSITTDFMWQNKKGEDIPFRLVDTAGLRRRARITDKVEKLSTSNAMLSLKYAQIVALIIDPECPLEKQDLTIGRRIVDEGRGLLIVINKWDKVKEGKKLLDELEWRLDESLSQIKGVPILTCSALYGRNLDNILAAAVEVHEVWSRRISTARLNQWFNYAIERNPPPLVSGRRVKIRYMTQIKTRPPTFLLWSPRPEALPESWLRYLTNSLRDEFDLWGIPIRMQMRKVNNPYTKS